MEELPADIDDDDDDEHISKYEIPDVMLALTPVKATFPVLLTVTD